MGFETRETETRAGSEKREHRDEAAHRGFDSACGGEL